MPPADLPAPDSLPAFLPVPSPETVRHARRRIGKAAPAPLRRALIEIHSANDPAAADALHVMAAVGLCFWRAYAAAAQRSGRDVVRTTFALHAALGHAAAASTLDPAARDELAPLQPWLDGLAESRDPLRATLMQWIDAFCERLTLHRYVGRGHRRRHARILIADPIRRLWRLPGAADDDDDPLARHAELALRYWDLLWAERLADFGWNRLRIESGAELGGTYGLGDQIQPPAAEEIRAAAEQLASELQIAPPVAAVAGVSVLRDQMQAALSSYLRANRWNDSDRPDPPHPSGGILQRLVRLFGRRLGGGANR
jgi:hypothetical protein